MRAAEVGRHYGLRLGPLRRLHGGDEARIWRARSDQGTVVVRQSPVWRAPDQLRWTHGVAAFAAVEVPEAVAPLRAADGDTLWARPDGYVAVFPFVPGRPADRRRTAHRLAAAALLGRIHRRLLGWRGPDGPDRTWDGDRSALPDRDLDRWYRTVDLVRAPVHGDYYRRNLRWADRRVTGIIDWDDAHIDFLLAEAAWASWEFAKNAAGDDLHLPAARLFLAAYHGAGGPEPSLRDAVPFIRLRLRAEVRWALGAAARGEPCDAAYMRAEEAAFHRLRDLSLAD